MAVCPPSCVAQPTSIGRILDHNQNEVLVGGDHDLVLLAADAQERQIVAGVQITDDAARLVRQLAHQSGVLDGGRIVQRALHRNACGDREWRLFDRYRCSNNEIIMYSGTFVVDDNRADDSLVGGQPLQRFLDFLRLSGEEGR